MLVLAMACAIGGGDGLGVDTDTANTAPTEVACQPGTPILGCTGYDSCCEGRDGIVTACWYETPSGGRYDCLSPSDCNAAAVELVCETCGLCDTGDTGG